MTFQGSAFESSEPSALQLGLCLRHPANAGAVQQKSSEVGLLHLSSAREYTSAHAPSTYLLTYWLGFSSSMHSLGQAPMPRRFASWIAFRPHASRI